MDQPQIVADPSGGGKRPLSQNVDLSFGGGQMTELLMMQQQNLEPYDVLFLSQNKQSQNYAAPSTTPDVALQSQLIQHRMRSTPLDHHQHQNSGRAVSGGIPSNYPHQSGHQQRHHESSHPSPQAIHHLHTAHQGASPNQQIHRRSHHGQPDHHHPVPYHHQVSQRLSNISSGVSSTDQDGSQMGTWSGKKVSAKIQQLLNTLKKPRKRHLAEFYEDDDIELELAANPKGIT